MQRATLILAGAAALQAPTTKRPQRTTLRSEPAGGWDTSRYGEAGTALTMADESPFASSPQAEVQSVGEGLHGEASCFLPLDQLDNGVLWPRIVRVAGIYPGLTQAEVTAVPMAPEPPEQDGLWLFDFPASGSEFQTTLNLTRWRRYATAPPRRRRRASFPRRMLMAPSTASWPCPART